MANILILHGPNLNMLGKREPEIYGDKSLAVINAELTQRAEQLQHQLTIHQSNAEHDLISWIQNAPENKQELIIINPGAYTHTSIAIRDALLSVNIPFIEVHLSNTFARESFRHQSYLSDIARGLIIGFGDMSYHYALYAANDILRIRNK